MSIVGLFAQSRPQIAGLYFDAVLEESSELVTEVTEFPVETGAVGNDHAVQRPLKLSMTVGVSDNPARALRASAADGSVLAGNAASTGIGSAISTLSRELAAAAGLSLTAINAAFAAGQAKVRSQSVLDQIRTIQRANVIISVVTAKREYQNVMITGTRQRTTKENEQGLELLVEMTQLLTVQTPQAQQRPVPAPNDPAETQAQQTRDLGQVVPQ